MCDQLRRGRLALSRIDSRAGGGILLPALSAGMILHFSEKVVPRLIDHDQRRKQIAAIVEEIVYEHGADALTIRDVAGRVGCSTTVVSHYFRTKLEMLLFTHQLVRSRAEALLEDAVRNRSSLEEALLALLPVSDQRKRDWNTWFAFWGMAPADPRVTAEWFEGASQAKSLFEDLIRIGQEKGEIVPAIEPRMGAMMVQVIMNGIASLWTQERDRFTVQTLRGLLHRMLADAGLAQAFPEREEQTGRPGLASVSAL